MITVDGDQITVPELGAAPSTPASGYAALFALASGLYTLSDGGEQKRLGLRYSEANVSNPPTDAELDSAFGTPAAVGEGYMALVNDAGADTNVYIVFSTGAVWVYAALTVAV